MLNKTLLYSCSLSFYLFISPMQTSITPPKTLFETCLDYYTHNFFQRTTDLNSLLNLKKKLPALLYDQLIAHFAQQHRWHLYNYFCVDKNESKNNEKITKDNIKQILLLKDYNTNEITPQLINQVKKDLLVTHSSDSHYKAIYSMEENWIAIFETKTKKLLGQLITDYTYISSPIFFDTYFAASIGGNLCIWELKNLTSTNPLQPFKTQQIQSPYIIPCKNKIFYQQNNRLNCWEFTTYNKPKKLPIKLTHNKSIIALCMYKDMLAYVTYDTISIFDLCTKNLIKRFKVNTTPYELCFVDEQTLWIKGNTKDIFVCHSSPEDMVITQILKNAQKTKILTQSPIKAKIDITKDIKKQLDGLMKKHVATLFTDSSAKR